MSNIELFHGTSLDKPGMKFVVNKKVPLIAYFKPQFPESSGSLIDNPDEAEGFANRRGSRPALLLYSLPIALVTCIGNSSGSSGLTYISTQLIDGGNIPDYFFKNARISKDIAQDMINEGLISFHQIPCKYLKVVVYY